MPNLNNKGLPHNGKPLKPPKSVPLEETIERRMRLVEEHFQKGLSITESAKIIGIPYDAAKRLVRLLRIETVRKNPEYVDEQLALSLANMFETSMNANELLHDNEFLRTAEPERIEAIYQIASDTGARILQFAAIRAKFSGERPDTTPLLPSGGR